MTLTAAVAKKHFPAANFFIFQAGDTYFHGVHASQGNSVKS